MSSSEYTEYERKYLVNEADLTSLPNALLAAPTANYEQFYVNQPKEKYELRFRYDDLSSGCTATLKSGALPKRMEVETDVTQQTQNYWRPIATRILKKQRKEIKINDEIICLDHFEESDIWLVEVEGHRIGQLAVGQEVTHDVNYRSYNLASLVNDSQSVNGESDQYKSLLSRVQQLAKLSISPIIIGVAGGSASGKTTIARNLVNAQNENGAVLNQDNYYLGLTKMYQKLGQGVEINFDIPSALDIGRLATDLAKFKQGFDLQHPIYDMSTSEPSQELGEINHANTKLLVVEGIHALHPALLPHYDHTMFIDAPMITRIGRRIERDLQEGRSMKPDANLKYMLETSEPCYKPFETSQKLNANEVFKNL